MNKTKQMSELSETFENWPQHIACKDNKIVVTESYRFHIISDDKKVITIGKGQASKRDGEFDWARGVAIKDDIIYIADQDNHRIQLFSLTTGQYLSNFPVQGRFPYGVMIAEDKLYISCLKPNQIEIYSLTGKHQKSWKCSSPPWGLTYSNNLLFICEGGYNQPHQIEVLSAVSGESVKKFGNKGTGVEQFDYPTDIVVKDDLVYISDEWNNRIQVWRVTGEHVRCWGVKGSKDGELLGPCGLALRDEELYVVDVYNSRVQIFK